MVSRKNKDKLPGLLLGVIDGGSLERRILRLMDRRMPWARRGRWVAAGCCTAVLVAAAVGAGMVGVRASLGEDAGPVPRFEVATIKPIMPNVPHRIQLRVYPGGRLVVNTVSLRGLIQDAYHLSPFELTGGEGWMDKDEYDVDARPSEEWHDRIKNGQVSWFDIEDEHVREMLQALLVERFHLKLRRETKIGKVYLLERSNRPLALTESKAFKNVTVDQNHPPMTGQFGQVGGKGTMLFNMSMLQLAKFYGGYVLHQPVIDKTGLPGYYDFTSKVILTNEDIQRNDPTQPLEVLPEMGLKLTQTQGPVETFVIEHAERPSAN